MPETATLTALLQARTCVYSFRIGDTGVVERDAALKKILLALLPLAVLASVSIAQADPVQEFSFQLKDVKSDGRFTVVFTSRTFDTTGASRRS